MEELFEQMADTVLSTKVKVAHPGRMPGLKGPFSKRQAGGRTAVGEARSCWEERRTRLVAVR
jgi:hypothetical protein